jgi:hypothetical protein
MMEIVVRNKRIQQNQNNSKFNTSRRGEKWVKEKE